MLGVVAKEFWIRSIFADQNNPRLEVCRLTFIMPSEDEVDDCHRPPTKDFRCLLEEVSGHFVLT